MDLPPKPSWANRKARQLGARQGNTRSSSSQPGTSELIEYWRYSGRTNEDWVFKTSRIEDDEVAGRLREPEPLHGQNSSAPSAGLRLICKAQPTSRTDPFEAAILLDIKDAIGIPPALQNYRHGSGWCGQVAGQNNRRIYLFYRSNNNSTASALLGYDPASNITTGYTFLGPEISTPAVESVIQAHFSNTPHPLLIPILLAELTADDLMQRLEEVHAGLADIEQRTGFGDWPEECLDSHDYRGLARTLGMLDCKFAFVDVAVRCTMMSVEFTKGHISALLTGPSQPSSPPPPPLDPITVSLSSRAEILYSNLRHMQIFAGIAQRMQAQQNVIFNLISQQDSLLNMELARDSKELAESSKRDSAAMKIIAFLTTLFLPGTFISTLFAMPLFEWNATTMKHVPSNKFWVYWAVTAPLTTVVMGVVALYAMLQEREKRKAVESARKNAGAAKLAKED